MSPEIFETVIGLEVHIQLGTESKLFCACPARSFGAAANSNVCPVCTGQPGSLPALNRRAVQLAIRAALALDCRVAPRSVFARKNYFYPDLPKGYQISQFEHPYGLGGALEIEADGRVKRINLERIHMEEDAGKLMHDIGGEKLDGSLVDLNRAGVPLIEIVSKPDMGAPAEAYQYLTTLKTVLQYVEVSKCDMEKGEMRCDANVSLRPKENHGGRLGVKVEVKNLNSFKAVQGALEYEIERQAKVLGSGGRVAQETRLWDADLRQTRSMRSKEEAHDYRYFPEPDLPPLAISAKWVEEVRAELPELPQARRRRLREEHGLSAYDIGVLTAQRALADYFERGMRSQTPPPSAKLLSNWITTELLGRLNAASLDVAQSPVSTENLAALTALIEKGSISGKMAKEVFGRMWSTGRAAGDIVAEAGLSQVSDDGLLRQWIETAIRENEKAAADVRGGKTRAVAAIVGAVMQKSRGKANPAKVNQLILELLK